GVRACGAEGDARGHRRRRAAGGAAGDERTVVAAPTPGIGDVAVVTGHVGRAHGELVHVGLAEHDRAGAPQVGGDGRFIGRLEPAGDGRAGGGGGARGGEGG